MRPLRIAMQAFGSFVYPQEIDFTRNDAFFLISGDTGSGKTTIFDAMMFALYGEIPGTRDAQGVTSLNAPENTSPKVELEFRMAGRQYKVVRTPLYFRSKKRGEGFTEEPESVAFYTFHDEVYKPVTGKTKTEINTAIIDLIKLSAEEFSKVVLLPQGEFQKFLVARTDEKMLILQKLFPVSDHEAVAALCREKRNSSKRVIDSYKNMLQQLRENFDPDSYKEEQEKLQQRLETNIASMKKLDDVIDALKDSLAKGRLLETTFQEHDVAVTKFSVLETQTNVMRENEHRLVMAESANNVLPLVEQCSRLAEELSRLHKESITAKDRCKDLRCKKEEAGKMYATIPAIDVKIKEYNEQLGTLRSLVPKVAVKKELTRKIASLIEKGKTFKSELEHCQNEDKQHKEKLQALKQEDKSLSESQKDDVVLLEKIQEYKKQEEQSVLLASKREKSASILSENEEILNEMQLQEATLRLNEKQLDHLKDVKSESLAATLAQQLKKQTPCPVCGSLDHPHPANQGIEPFSANQEQALEIAEANVRNAEKELAKLTEQYKKNTLHLKELEQEIEKIAATVSMEYEEIEKVLAALYKEKEVIFSGKERLAEIKSVIEKIESDLEILRIKIDTMQTEFTNQKNEYSSLSGQLQEINNDLDLYPDIEKEIGILEQSLQAGISEKRQVEDQYNAVCRDERAIEERLLLLEKNITHAKENFEVAKSKMTEVIKDSPFENADSVYAHAMKTAELNILKKNLAAYKEDRLKAETMLTELQKKVKGLERPDLKKIELELDDATNQRENILDERTKCEVLINEHESNCQQYKELMEKIDNEVKSAKLTEELSRELNGDNSKNVTFQSFVLGSYLDDVLAFANERLLKISDGQYSLFRRMIKAKGKTHSGLELDVLDLYNGCKRHVQTLSGGEKFLASISLALGLSDVIQSRAGGIELDALFIDEGFGSLDERSLDRAITILDEIRGNRMVGIISHVKELKEQIPSKIIVTKQSGSSFISQT